MDGRCRHQRSTRACRAGGIIDGAEGSSAPAVCGSGTKQRGLTASSGHPGPWPVARVPVHAARRAASRHHPRQSGLSSYRLAQRSREIGARSALGARPVDIVMLVVGQGLVVSAGGLAVGISVSLWLARSMESFIYGISVRDLTTFVVVPVVLLAVSAIACFVPARRAARLDPLQVLKAGRSG